MTALRRELGRVGRVTYGLDVGFADAAVSSQFRELCGGQWMTMVADESVRAAVAPHLAAGSVHRIGVDSTLPFEDRQFDVVVLNGAVLSLPLVREIHRVLKPSGRLLFEVREEVRHGRDSTSAKIYNSFLRAGFNVTSLIRPAWWKFGFGDNRLTVVASRKNWREGKGFGKK